MAFLQRLTRFAKLPEQTMQSKQRVCSANKLFEASSVERRLSRSINAPHLRAPFELCSEPLGTLSCTTAWVPIAGTQPEGNSPVA